MEVCEALGGGVKARQFWHYMDGSYDLKVRRLKDAAPELRARVAYYAAVETNTSYGFGTLLAIKDSLTKNDPWKRRIFPSRGVICSQLYFEACMRAGFLLAHLKPERVSPAHLSASEELVDVPLKWISLENSTDVSA